MSTGDRFGRFIKDELGCRSVWPPVLTPMQLGDYGVTDGASFQKLGNIADFGLKLEIEVGQLISFVSHPYEKYTVDLYLYECTITSGEPSPMLGVSA